MKMNKETLKQEIKNILPHITEIEEEVLISFIKNKIVDRTNTILSWIQLPKHNVSSDMDSYNTYVITDKDITSLIQDFINNEE